MKIQACISALSVSLSLAVAAGSPAFAQAPAAPASIGTPKIDQRQVKQQGRIDEGVASGSLTSKEVAKLDARQDRIAAQEAAAKADGVVTKTERRKLMHEQNHASRAIKRQKHDGKKVAAAAK